MKDLPFIGDEFRPDTKSDDLGQMRQQEEMMERIYMIQMQLDQLMEWMKTTATRRQER